MIYDYLSNIDNYRFQNPALARAFAHLQKLAANPPAVGRYEGDDPDNYFMVQQYPTRASAECKWESHQQYIDIQYISNGHEWMAHAERGSLQRTGYLPEKDFDGYQPTSPDGYNRLDVRAGMFVVFYPHDAHMPCLCGEDGPVRRERYLTGGPDE